ncbi:hypothetical protein JCM10212_005386 [Sporobolomyces blumeae]
MLRDPEKAQCPPQRQTDEDDPSDGAVSTAPSPAKTPVLPSGLALTPIEGSEVLVLTFTRTPAHPDDPLCRSLTSKFIITLVAALVAMLSALASSCSSGAAPFIQADLGGNTGLPLSLYLFGYVLGPFVTAPLSETYGRRPVFLAGLVGFTIFMGATAASPNYGALLAFRFLAGATGGVPITNSGAVCGDVWDVAQRGTAMSYYSVATFAGPALGPVVASFAAVRINWHWSFLIPTIISGAFLVLTIVTLPETYPPVILSKLAEQLREATGDDRIVSTLELAAAAAKMQKRGARVKAEAYRLLGMPFILLFTEIIVALLTAYMSVLYGLIYLLFEGYPIIFSEIHHLGPGYSSLPFLSTFVGAILSVPITLCYQKRYIATMRRCGRPTPEARLSQAQYGGVMIVVAFVWLGWSGQYASVPWIVPTLSGLVQGVGSVLIFRACQTYLIDVYARYAASAQASNVAARSVAGAIFPLFAPTMFHRLGTGVACTILAACMLVLVPVPFIFERYGAELRRKSRYASEDR